MIAFDLTNATSEPFSTSCRRSEGAGTQPGACWHDTFFNETELAVLQSMIFVPDANPCDPGNELVSSELAETVGERVFNQLTSSEAISCSSCHGIGGHPLNHPVRNVSDRKFQRDTPPTWNLHIHRWYFWDGRTDRLWVAVLDALINELILQPTDTIDIIEPLRRHHKGEITEHPEQPDLILAAKSVSAFLLKQPQVETRFHAALREYLEFGTNDLLSIGEVRGLKLFIGRAGCITCHNGPYLSDGSFHALGIPELKNDHYDAGRYAAKVSLERLSSYYTKRYSYGTCPDGKLFTYYRRKDAMNGAFRTPSLIGVPSTGPYMHNGFLTDFKSVIEFYSTGGQSQPMSEWTVLRDHHNETPISPRLLSDLEVSYLEKFLHALEIAMPQ